MVDTGIGIPENKLEAIFEPFTQADGGATRKYGGTGLGLTISAHLVRLMRGELWAESAVGRGSEFHFTARFGVPIHSDDCISLPDLPFMHDLPVLVVEDSATARLILEELLGGLGMKPTLVESSSDALTALAGAAEHGEPFPLLLADATLRDTDGFALVECALRRKLVGAAVLMLSSVDVSADVERCRRSGAATYLRKPIKRLDLIRALRLVVDPTYVSKAMPRPEPRTAPVDGPTGLKVLVVEDNPFNQKVSAMKLERWGHHVTLAASGPRRWRSLRRNNSTSC